MDIDSESNLEYIPFPFGGTAALVPPWPAWLDGYVSGGDIVGVFKSIRLPFEELQLLKSATA